MTARVLDPLDPAELALLRQANAEQRLARLKWHTLNARYAHTTREAARELYREVLHLLARGFSLPAAFDVVDRAATKVPHD